jgi:uncharacterized protein (DUF58 family)
MGFAERIAGLDFGPVQQGEVLRLGLRNLYILPTRFGWLWLGGALFLQLVAIQLQSNGTLLLCFLMVALFLLTLHLTHFNLQGLELRCGPPRPGFAGSELAYPLLVRCRGRCDGLRLRLGEGRLGPPHSLEPGVHPLAVPWNPARRGLQRPGRLRLQTTAPLGLFVCWSRWDPPVPQLVVPARRPGPVRLRAPGPLPEEGDQGVRATPEGREGSEHWQDLRPHRSGDTASRLAWKLLAQGRGRHAKQFVDPEAGAPLLAPDPAVPFEQALEHLSERICRLHGQGSPYGLALADQLIPAATGPAQRDRCLAALATCR